MIKKYTILSVVILLTFNASVIFSNNLRMSDFRLIGTNVEMGILINVDSIYWENSWRNDIKGTGYTAPHNHDAIWFFAKYKLRSSNVWFPAKFTPSSGYHSLDPFCEIKTSSDSMGVFLFKRNNGTGTNLFRNTSLFFNGKNIHNSHDSVSLAIFAVEMVYIPQDSFYVGDGTTANIFGQLCGFDNVSPYRVVSENSITLGGLGANSLNNRNGTGMFNPDDFNNTTTKTLPVEFPKGYNSFYSMKYEVTSQQYTDFLNSIDELQASFRFSNTFGMERNAIQKIGNVYSTTAPDRANNYMSWADGAAYADWIGLRPMTELEIEKISRGPLNAVADECAWGNNSFVQMTSMDGVDGSGTETALPDNANCNYNLIDGGAGQPIGGPVRVGIFATSTSGRVESGASYYGVMEMTGNCWERNVSIGNVTGRLFNGLNGDGLLTINGDANVLNWPPASAEGSGYRMGNWFRSILRARVSDRFYASSTIPDRTGHRGFRCARTSN